MKNMHRMFKKRVCEKNVNFIEVCCSCETFHVNKSTLVYLFDAYRNSYFLFVGYRRSKKSRNIMGFICRNMHAKVDREISCLCTLCNTNMTFSSL